MWRACGLFENGICRLFTYGLGHHFYSRTSQFEELTQHATRLTAEIREVDSRLNAVYKNLQLRLDERGKFRLQQVQRAWISYRDNECKFIEEIESYGQDRMSYELAEKHCVRELTESRAAELEKAERRINQTRTIIPGEGARLSWPNHLRKFGQEGEACLSGTPELQLQIQDRLGKNHVYTTACQITESLFVLLSEQGGNGDPLSVLDLTRRGPLLNSYEGYLGWRES